MGNKEFRYGKGVNSIGFRLTSVYIVLTTLCLILVTKPFLAEHSTSDIGMHVGFAVVALMLTACLMVVVARRLTRPISNLTEIAGKIADGDLSVKIPVDCCCEIGGLAASMGTMVARLNASTSEIRELATTDTVTGLANRHRFQTLIDHRVGSIKTDGQAAKGSVFFIDILELGKVTNRFGHETSDQLISNIAGLLHDTLSAIGGSQFDADTPETRDTIQPLLARFGGNELVVSLPEMTEPEDIAAIAHSLHAALENGVEATGRQFRPQIAIGIARYPLDCTISTEVTQYAALACHNALSLAREKTCLFKTGMLDAIKDREAIEQDLRTAIVERQFEVYYQPKVSANDWAITGVEALVRLNHPERGVVGPVEFIKIAEMTGLIGDIGLIVLEEAISQCSAWVLTDQMIEVSVNVSIEQFQNSTFSEQLIALLHKYGCPARLLTIEITETIATTSVKGVADQIAALREEGVRIAIDDFGIGYSNLMQLAGLKFDILKVDRSFISGIECDGTSREVSRGIIQLGKNLGCKVVVEGTETQGQVTEASQLGCDEIQGFFFSKPMRVSDFEAWRELRSQKSARSPIETIISKGLARKSA